jgi:hypothetical protein
MSSLLIATPCYGKMIGEGYMHSFLATLTLLSKKGHIVKLHTVGNESLITRARNNQVAYFLSTKFDRLMFIDADIKWSPQAVLTLLESDYDVCGTPYPTKGRDWAKAINYIKNSNENQTELTPNGLMMSTLNFTVNKKPETEPLGDGWQEVSALGTGFFMIKRHVLETMRDHFRDTLNYKNDVKGYEKLAPPEHCVGLFETMIDPETRRYLSEDYAFCKRWISMGGKVHAYLKTKLTHSGTADF